MHTSVHLNRSIFFYKPRFCDFIFSGKFNNEEFDLANYPDSICSDALVRACVRPSAIKFIDKRIYQKKLFHYILNLFGLHLVDSSCWKNSCLDSKLLLEYNEEKTFAQEILAYECIESPNSKCISIIGDGDYFYFMHFPSLDDFDTNGKFAKETFDVKNSEGEILSDNVVRHCVHPFFISMPTSARPAYQKSLFDYIVSLFGMIIKFEFVKNRLTHVFEQVSCKTPQQLNLTRIFFVERQKSPLNFVNYC